VKLLTLLPVERRQELRFAGEQQLERLCAEFVAGGSERDRVRAGIVGVALANHQALALQRCPELEDRCAAEIRDIIRPLGHALTQLPVGSAASGPNAGFAFEMHYLMGNLVPWREPAWALLRERMAFLAQKCKDDPDVVRTAGEKAASLADKLAAHVPAELLSR